MLYMKEDIPYFDLTTSLQKVSSNIRARLEVYTREEVIVSCSEEAKRIAELMGCEVHTCIPSRQAALKGETLLSISGAYETVHEVWRRVQILLEYSCRIATYTHQMRGEIVRVNPHCELLTTRKSFPFAKAFCIRSVLNGGGMPHRLGLSETVLFFSQHRILYQSNAAFYEAITQFKIKVPEKKIVIEAETFGDAMALMQKGADVIQVDKADPQTLQEVVDYRKAHFPDVKILAAGGVNRENAALYAGTGVDGIVTSAVYINGMADLGSCMSLVDG